MIPKIADGGANFIGAGAYYLGEGKSDRSAEASGGILAYMLGGHAADIDLSGGRVGFAETRNMPTLDPAQGFAAMQAFYERFMELRKGARGRPLQQPVYSYSLSWAIGENPDKGMMIAAAEETLKVLGMSDHQTILVSHIDKAYAHVHVIVNRIKPDMTGVASKSMDRLKLSAWAENYERRYGKIHCEQRVANNALRRSGFIARDLVSKSRQEIEAERRNAWPVLNGLYQAEQKILNDVLVLADDACGQAHIAALEGVFAEVNAEADAGCDEVLRDYCPAFAKSYASEKRRIAHVIKDCTGPSERAAFVITNKDWLMDASADPDRELMLMSTSGDVLVERIRISARQERIAIGRRQKQSLEDAVRQIWTYHHHRIADILERQSMERSRAEQARQAMTSGDLTRVDDHDARAVVFDAIHDIWNRSDGRQGFKTGLGESGFRLRAGQHAWLVCTDDGAFVESLQRVLLLGAKAIERRIGSCSEVWRRYERRLGCSERGVVRIREERREVREMLQTHGDVDCRAEGLYYHLVGKDNFRRRFPRRLCRDQERVSRRLALLIERHDSAMVEQRRQALENVRRELDELTPAQSEALGGFERAVIVARTMVERVSVLLKERSGRRSGSDMRNEPEVSGAFDYLKQGFTHVREILPERKLKKAIEACKKAFADLRLALDRVFEVFRMLARSAVEAVSEFATHWNGNWQGVSTDDVRHSALALNVFASVKERLGAVVEKLAGGFFGVGLTPPGADLWFSIEVRQLRTGYRPEPVVAEIPDEFRVEYRERERLERAIARADRQRTHVNNIATFVMHLEASDLDPDHVIEMIDCIDDVVQRLKSEEFPVDTAITAEKLAALGQQRERARMQRDKIRHDEAEKKRREQENAARFREQQAEAMVDRLMENIAVAKATANGPAHRPNPQYPWNKRLGEALDTLEAAVWNEHDDEIVSAASTFRELSARAEQDGLETGLFVTRYESFADAISEAVARLESGESYDNNSGPGMGF